MLHDILGINHPESHRALLRIEDVSPNSDPSKLKAIADYLHSEGVPFVVSVIPEYRDPLGVFHGGLPTTIKLPDNPAMVDALRYLVARGGQIVLHGWTHQYDAMANPYNGVSAADYEFFRVSLDPSKKQVFHGPVPEDSPTWAGDRLSRGKGLLAMANLTAVAWLTPHYRASLVDYREFSKHFDISLDRGTYFATGEDGKEYMLEQMPPYVIQKDVYGIKRLPENIGYIDPAGQPPSLPADLILRAQKNKVVRDGWAGCYFHWFLDLTYLQELIPGIKEQGYRFVRVPAAWTPTPVVQLLLMEDSPAGLKTSVDKK